MVKYATPHPKGPAVKLARTGFQSRLGQAGSARGTIFDLEVKTSHCQPAMQKARGPLGADFTRQCETHFHLRLLKKKKGEGFRHRFSIGGVRQSRLYLR